MESILKENGIGQYSYIWESNHGYLSGVTVKISYVGLHLTDLILTNIGVSLGFSELNMWMKNLLTAPLQLMVFKLAIPILIAWLVPAKFLVPAIVLLLMVVCWDLRQLLPLLL
jgi:hypothetical protein